MEVNLFTGKSVKYVFTTIGSCSLNLFIKPHDGIILECIKHMNRKWLEDLVPYDVKWSIRMVIICNFTALIKIILPHYMLNIRDNFL